MSCDHLVSPGSVILDGFTVRFSCSKCHVAGSLEVALEDISWEVEGGDIVLPWDEDGGDDWPRRYESVPSFVEDEPIPFLPTPKANRAVRD